MSDPTNMDWVRLTQSEKSFLVLTLGFRRLVNWCSNFQFEFEGQFDPMGLPCKIDRGLVVQNDSRKSDCVPSVGTAQLGL